MQTQISLSEKAAEELIDLIVAKYNVITIIQDDWEDINEELADGDYQEWS